MDDLLVRLLCGTISVSRFHLGLFRPNERQRRKFAAIDRSEVARRSFRAKRLHGVSEVKKRRFVEHAGQLAG